jgi:hypothetical protein
MLQRMRGLAQRQPQYPPATLRLIFRQLIARLALLLAMTTSLARSTPVTPRRASVSTHCCQKGQVARERHAQRAPSAKMEFARMDLGRLAWPAINAMWPVRATQSRGSVRILQLLTDRNVTMERVARLRTSAALACAKARSCSVPRVHIAVKMLAPVSETMEPLDSLVPWWVEQLSTCSVW